MIIMKLTKEKKEKEANDYYEAHKGGCGQCQK